MSTTSNAPDSPGLKVALDFLLGYRGGSIGIKSLQQYVFVAVNTAGETNYAAFGLSARFGDQFFVRPGLGLAVHTGSAENFQDPTNGKVDFGSRVLFEPELALGTRINDRMSVEASWVHMSTARCSAGKTPGSTISACA